MVSKTAIHNSELWVALITLGLSLASRAENFCNDYSELNAAPSQFFISDKQNARFKER
jgi:hypothetical protein